MQQLRAEMGIPEPSGARRPVVTGIPANASPETREALLEAARATAAAMDERARLAALPQHEKGISDEEFMKRLNARTLTPDHKQLIENIQPYDPTVFPEWDEIEAD